MNENETIIHNDSNKCPDCGAECGIVENTCMFGSFSKDDFYYCPDCRRTYACDSNGRKIWIN